MSKEEISNILRNFFYKITRRVVDKGINNHIEIASTVSSNKFKIKVFGNNNKIIIKDNVLLHNVYIKIGFAKCPANNCTVIIGENTKFRSTEFFLGEDNSSILVGDDCLFSYDVVVSCSDTHAILDKDNNVINIGKEVVIGNHVWVCQNAVILKNTKIPDNCILARNAVLAKKYEVSNAIYAGNPAKLVKENINWSKDRPNNYVDFKGY